jgi:homoserine dehydrogenase
VGFKLGLLGLGTVGVGTVKILLDPIQRQPLVKDLELHRVGVRSLDKPREVALPADLLTTDLDAIVTDPAIDIVVEVMGGLEPARSLILRAIAHGKHIVTANKALIARYGEEIFTAAGEAGVYVMLEAAVGGGIPVIAPLKQSLCSNRIQRVSGIINGTTNYILSRMALEGGDFSEILADAQRLGYAEADPTADVDGWDAADKIAILASLAFGGRIHRDQVYCEGIRNITAADITYAERLNFVIKLLATAARDASAEVPDQIEVRVHPTLLPKDHPLASVNGVYNAILVEGEPVGQVMFYGPGAGSGPTASAVVADVLNIAALLSLQDQPGATRLNPLLACSHHHYSTLAPIEAIQSRFYLRLLIQDSIGVIGRIGTIFGQYGVSLESVVQTKSPIDSPSSVSQADRVELVVITHHVPEGKVRQALEDIAAMDIVLQVANVLRAL